MDWLGAFLVNVIDKYCKLAETIPYLDDFMDMSVLFFAVAQIICAVGLFIIYSKMRTKRWPALIPVVGIYWLGELIHRRIAAVFIVISKIMILSGLLEYLMILYYPLSKNYDIFMQYNTRVLALSLLVIGAAFLIRMVAGWFLYGHLCRQYEVRKWWLVPFSVVPNITLLFWSINPRIRDWN